MSTSMTFILFFVACLCVLMNVCLCVCLCVLIHAWTWNVSEWTYVEVRAVVCVHARRVSLCLDFIDSSRSPRLSASPLFFCLSVSLSCICMPSLPCRGRFLSHFKPLTLAGRKSGDGRNPSGRAGSRPLLQGAFVFGILFIISLFVPYLSWPALIFLA